MLEMNAHAYYHCGVNCQSHVSLHVYFECACNYIRNSKGAGDLIGDLIKGGGKDKNSGSGLTDAIGGALSGQQADQAANGRPQDTEAPPIRAT